MTDLRDRSRAAFDAPAANSWESLQVGCLQRIADATEKMAQPYLSLVADAKRYQEWYEDRGRTIDHLHRRIAALRGVITKMKGKA